MRSGWIGAHWAIGFVLAAVALAPPGLSPAADLTHGGPFINDGTWRALVHAYSGEAAAVHIRELSRFHRISGGGLGYRNAVQYVADVLKADCDCDVIIDRHLSDGDRTYMAWRSMPGWEARRADLWLERTGERLASYAEVPVSLFVYSNGGEVSAPAVLVGRGISDADYAGVEIAGKIAVATGDGDAVHRKAVIERGAAAVVVGPPETDDLCRRFPDLVRMQTLRANKSLRERTRFGFSLSRARFERLLGVFQDGGEVRLKASVDARQYDAEMETVSALFRGSAFPEQEMILSAHLDHYSPGANDNASGSATLLEIARTLTSLVRRGVIARPKRSIRFLWVGEMHGFAGYLAGEEDIGKRGIAAINMDMVGEDTHKTRSLMTMVRPPYSNPSFIGDLVERMAAIVDGRGAIQAAGEGGRLHFRSLPFKGGSDHLLLSDPTIGVPCVNIGHDGDVFHHTSQDDMDKIDIAELKKSGLIALGALLFVANAGDTEAAGAAFEVAEQGVMRLAERTKRHQAEVAESLCGEAKNRRPSLEEALAFIDVQALAEAGAVRSVGELSAHPHVRDLIERLAGDLDRFAASEKARLRLYHDILLALKGAPMLPTPRAEDERGLREITPRRLFRGPLSQFLFEDLVGEGMSWYAEYARLDRAWTDRRAEILNFMDGRRSLFEIYRLVCAEMGPSDPKYYLRLVEDLKKAGLVSYGVEKGVPE